MQLVDFITKHWVLCALLVLVLLLFLQQEWQHRRAGILQITPEQAVQWMNQQQALVIDIRSQAAFAQGHLIGSLPIEEAILQKKIQSLEQYRQRPLIIVCQAGRTAMQAAQRLKQQGFKAVVLGGGLQEWTSKGLPLVQ
jgi:rhodanese-related sulfurtransferase